MPPSVEQPQTPIDPTVVSPTDPVITPSLNAAPEAPAVETAPETPVTETASPVAEVPVAEAPMAATDPIPATTEAPKKGFFAKLFGRK